MVDEPDEEFRDPDDPFADLTGRPLSEPDEEFVDFEEIRFVAQATSIESTRVENFAAATVAAFVVVGVCALWLFIQWSALAPLYLAIDKLHMPWRFVAVTPFVIVLLILGWMVQKAFGTRAASRGTWAGAGFLALLLASVTQLPAAFRVVLAVMGLFIVASQIFDETAADCRRLCLDRLGLKIVQRWIHSRTGRRILAVGTGLVCFAPVLMAGDAPWYLRALFLVFGVLCLSYGCFLERIEKTAVWQRLNQSG